MRFKEIESQLKKGFHHLAEVEGNKGPEEEIDNQVTNKDNKVESTDKEKDKEKHGNKEYMNVQNPQEDQGKGEVVNREVETDKVRETKEKQNNSERNGLGQRREGEYRRESGSNKVGQVARSPSGTKEESWKTRSSIREHRYAKRKSEETAGSEVQLKRSRTDKSLLWIVGDSMIRGIILGRRRIILITINCLIDLSKINQ